MPFDSPDQIIAVATAMVLILAGFQGFRRARISTGIRVGLGIAMLAIGAVMLHHLIQSDDLWAHPIRFGLGVALAGLGINQAATPLRLALGKPA